MSMETWKSRRFVEEFQRRAGLLIDGKPGPQTQMALEFVPELPPGRIYPAVPELPEHLRTTPTPIDPADIRPGDVVEYRQRINVTKVDHDGWIYEGPWGFSAEGDDGDGRVTWHLVHRPNPDAEVVEAIDVATAREGDHSKTKREWAADTLAALREQGWDVVRRAES